MRITLAIVYMTALCLSLAPIAARPHSSLSTDSNIVNTKQVDETTPSPLGTHQDFLNPLAFPLGEERRLLKTSNSSGSKSKSSKSKKSKKIKWSKGRGKATLLGSIVGVSVFIGVFLLCTVFLVVTEKREEDPNWRMRTFLRRKLRRKYTIKSRKAGKGDDMEDMEKPHVEKELPKDGDSDTKKDAPV